MDRPVTFCQGQRRPAWFNVWRLPPGNDEYDELGVSESISIIENIILAQVHSGIDSRKIVLVGFSQGGALSLMVGLTSLHELGGIASLSGWIPHHIRDVSQASIIRSRNSDIAPKQMIYTGQYLPILWCHGANDNDIPDSYGEDAISFIRHSLYIPEQCLTYRRYEGLAHSINDAELGDLVSWLMQILG